MFDMVAAIYIAAGWFFVMVSWQQSLQVVLRSSTATVRLCSDCFRAITAARIATAAAKSL